MDNPGIVVRFPAGARRFSLRQKRPEWLWGTLILLFKRCHRLFPYAYREDDKSPVSSDKVENERSYTSASPYTIELNITEISVRYKIRLVEFIHNTAQASLWPKIWRWLTLRRLMSYIYGAPILDVSRSHTTTQHSRYDSSGRVISSSQRPLPDNTRHSQQTNIHAPGGIRTQDLSRRAATGRSPAEIVGSNPNGGMDICLLWVSCVVR